MCEYTRFGYIRSQYFLPVSSRLSSIILLICYDEKCVSEARSIHVQLKYTIRVYIRDLLIIQTEEELSAGVKI